MGDEQVKVLESLKRLEGLKLLVYPARINGHMIDQRVGHSNGCGGWRVKGRAWEWMLRVEGRAQEWMLRMKGQAQVGIKVDGQALRMVWGGGQECQGCGNDPPDLVHN